MSMGGEMMEEMYDKRVQEFWEFLKEMAQHECGGMTLDVILEKYEEHFKNFGIYGTS